LGEKSKKKEVFVAERMVFLNVDLKRVGEKLSWGAKELGQTT